MSAFAETGCLELILRECFIGCQPLQSATELVLVICDYQHSFSIRDISAIFSGYRLPSIITPRTSKSA